MLTLSVKNRWQAFGIHLLISLVIFIAMCLIIVLFWYPGMLFATEGGWQGVRLIAGIDFVIGPTLTLIVYNKAKKELKYDLAIIGLLQAICIAYGMYVVHNSRPAVVAYADGVYYTTPLLRFESRGIDISKNELLKNEIPTWVNIKLPSNKEERLALKIQYLSKGLETSIDLYEPYSKAIPLLKNEGFSIEEASAAGISIPPDLDPHQHRIYKFNTRYNTYAVAANINTGEIAKLLDVVYLAEIGLVPVK